MKLIVRLALLFYVTVILFLGCTAIIYVLNLVPMEQALETLQVVYQDDKLRLIVGIVGGVILLLNYSFWRGIVGEYQREKTIAFDNPNGRVTVSLSAIEDLIKRLTLRMPEIKEVRPTIKAGKRGLDIQARLVLNTDLNLPEITSQLQDLIKRKIHDTISIEGNVTVRVHVAKILAEDMNKRKRKDRHFDEEPNPEPNIPFQGYRA